MKKFNLLSIIEDDATHLFITKKMIEMSGTVENISVYRNGKEAFDGLTATYFLNKTLPEIILLDLNMPIWDGWRFLEEFTKLPIDNKPVIYILTSSNSEEDKIQAEKYNLRQNYLIKPISLNEIKKVLTDLDLNC